MQGKWPCGPLEGQFKPVIVRVAHVLVVRIGADLIWEGSTRSIDHCAIRLRVDEILSKRSAGRRTGRDLRWLTQAETESGVAWIRAVNRQQVSAKGADVADT